MKKHTCNVCGWDYDGSEGPFENLPDDYVCPVCGAGKDEFEASEEAEAAPAEAPADDGLYEEAADFNDIILDFLVK